MDVQFRATGVDDHASTREVADAAFRPEDVVTFLDALRTDGCVLGKWLAEDSSGPIGLVVFSRILVEQDDGNQTKAALLTPLGL
jgi:predicted N-acetyltransferase YhbS